MLVSLFAVALMLVIGSAVRRALDAPAPRDDPSETSASPGVQVTMSEPLDRPVIAVPGPRTAFAPVASSSVARPIPVMATPLTTRIRGAPRRAPAAAGGAGQIAPRSEAASDTTDLADDAAAAGMTAHVSQRTKDRP